MYVGVMQTFKYNLPPIKNLHHTHTQKRHINGNQQTREATNNNKGRKHMQATDTTTKATNTTDNRQKQKTRQERTPKEGETTQRQERREHIARLNAM